MAVQMERNGSKFYRKAAGFSQDEVAGAMLLDLAAMEDQHEVFFNGLLAAEAGRPAGKRYFDPEGEAALYIRAVSDNRVFKADADPSAFIRADTPIGDILRKAIGLEKDTIIFYLGIRDLVPARLGKDQIDGIIREEMRHVTLLTDKLIEQTTA
jgi:rubrerythrin